MVRVVLVQEIAFFLRHKRGMKVGIEQDETTGRAKVVLTLADLRIKGVCRTAAKSASKVQKMILW
jgi:ApbE superfamily uncharacterized protein (UPF0280 family)